MTHSFIRPRRFGKSIFLSMLRAYYDITQKEKFDKRFGNLWIGNHPTPLQGKFQVVYLDFSHASGGNGSLTQNFDDYCSMAEEGQIVTNLITTFPATQIANPEIFPSLLFYYGMLTITAKRGNYLVLSIPNNNVRKQYYEFLLEEYQASKDTEEKAETQWKEAVEQIKKYAAAPKVRQLIHDTKLHCIVMQIRRSELERMEEVQ